MVHCLLKLNDGAEGEWELVDYNTGPRFSAMMYRGQRHNILPGIAKESDVAKVVELCLPELDILFGVE